MTDSVFILGGASLLKIASLSIEDEPCEKPMQPPPAEPSPLPKAPQPPPSHEEDPVECPEEGPEECPEEEWIDEDDDGHCSFFVERRNGHRPKEIFGKHSNSTTRKQSGAVERVKKNTSAVSKTALPAWGSPLMKNSPVPARLLPRCRRVVSRPPRQKPARIVCFLCGKEAGIALIHMHFQKCLGRWDHRQGLPLAMELTDPRAIPKTHGPDLDAYNLRAMEVYRSSMPQCPRCGKKFVEKSIVLHIKLCCGSKWASVVHETEDRYKPEGYDPLMKKLDAYKRITRPTEQKRGAASASARRMAW
uniref:Uncharacterized protein n=1 Tax=Octactis speculum TaxID=3111310 RepID=A0A7S2CGQ3_9STRA|mmetsp:Transcript_35782/g.48335  ORF Transcript_35782/g.48335 Transcript_35782/m.48335 type:complete len:304 (+) Transcript_35782:42-953(+)|eukprot:CAMPEP_0185754500 /NCGR_PEP_ID=MMETSP1174-20130828/13145_1 /TAXON_ID=35687 /ORGANISM="Dictyocha speculum, Strain CCMP1381" /LENGTH=303 /DNA_ID=CAMNT_0028432737 /DNA_START=29 /DNA_END=940 /DNA_ORIENTATION=+